MILNFWWHGSRPTRASAHPDPAMHGFFFSSISCLLCICGSAISSKRQKLQCFNTTLSRLYFPLPYGLNGRTFEVQYNVNQSIIIFQLHPSIHPSIILSLSSSHFLSSSCIFFSLFHCPFHSFRNIYLSPYQSASEFESSDPILIKLIITPLLMGLCPP